MMLHVLSQSWSCHFSLAPACVVWTTVIEMLSAEVLLPGGEDNKGITLDAEIHPSWG